MPKDCDLIVRVEMSGDLTRRLDEMRSMIDRAIRERTAGPSSTPLPLIAAGLVVAGSTTRTISRRRLLGLGWFSR